MNVTPLLLAAIVSQAVNADEFNPARPYLNRTELDQRDVRVLVGVRIDSDLARLESGELSPALSARISLSLLKRFHIVQTTRYVGIPCYKGFSFLRSTGSVFQTYSRHPQSMSEAVQFWGQPVIAIFGVAPKVAPRSPPVHRDFGGQKDYLLAPTTRRKRTISAYSIRYLTHQSVEWQAIQELEKLLFNTAFGN